MMHYLRCLLLTGLITGLAAGSATASAQTVVPKAEKEAAGQAGMEGPSKTTGIKGVKTLGTAALDGEFPSPNGRMLRVRELEILPGGVVAVHRHDGRPGVAYILAGEMTEYRAGEDAPAVRKPGDIALEQTGVTHWWKNTGSTTAKALVVDIVPAK